MFQAVCLESKPSSSRASAPTIGRGSDDAQKEQGAALPDIKCCPSTGFRTQNKADVQPTKSRNLAVPWRARAHDPCFQHLLPCNRRLAGGPLCP